MKIHQFIVDKQECVRAEFVGLAKLFIFQNLVNCIANRQSECGKVKHPFVKFELVDISFPKSEEERIARK